MNNSLSPSLSIFKNYEELSLAAANIIADVVISNPQAIFLLPTGKTPLRMYEILVKKSAANTLNLKNTTIFMLDEYLEGEDYRHYIEDNLTKRIPVGKCPKVFVLNGRTNNVQMETQSYEKRIQEMGIDLAVLGVNADGHIGFNEPGSSFESITRKVDLSPRTISDNRPLMERVKKGGEPYIQALTVGISTCLLAKKIVVIASGAQKKDPIKFLLTGKPSPQVPISALLLAPQKVTVLVDEPAAELL